MRIIARYEKGASIRYISHLDILRTMQRALRRADIPVAYSQGFNPHQQLSFATALSLGFTSSAEWMDIKLESDIDAECFMQKVNAVLPQGLTILETQAADDRTASLSAMMCAASYTVTVDAIGEVELKNAVQELLNDEINVLKHTKAGMRTVDIRPMIYSMEVDWQDTKTEIKIYGRLDSAGSLNVELLMGALQKLIDRPIDYCVNRDCIYSADGSIMPAWRPL